MLTKSDLFTKGPLTFTGTVKAKSDGNPYKQIPEDK